MMAKDLCIAKSINRFSGDVRCTILVRVRGRYHGLLPQSENFGMQQVS